MYQTVTQIRNKLGYMIPSGDYSDDTVEALGEKTTAIVNGYLGQSIENSATSEKVIAIPHLASGFTVTLNRRFIESVSSFEIEYGYGIDNYEFNSDDYFLDAELGLLETKDGACPQFLFATETNDKYLADVTYTAGYENANLPSDFVEAFYMLYEKVFDNYKHKVNPSELSPTSSSVKKYKTLHEDVTFADSDAINKAGDALLGDTIETILDKYSMPKQGIGRFM